MIFISIDDGEAAGLTQIAGEVFGRSNVIASVAWEKRYTRSNNANRFYSVKDTIVVCRRSEAAREVKELRGEDASRIYNNPDGDPRGPWTSSSYVNPATKEARPNLAYAIERPSGGLVEHPTHAWKFSSATHEEHVADDRLWWGADGEAQYPRLKVFLSEAEMGMVPIDLWSHEDAGTTDSGGAEVKELFGAAVFDFPKPTSLLRKILTIFVPPWETWTADFLVLDFFAGSSTTAHAVLAQNAEDGGNRRFVMVQLPEPCHEGSIASREGYKDIATLSRDRIRRAGERLLATSDNDDWDRDIGFRTLRIDTGNMADVVRTPDTLTQEQLGLHAESVRENRSGEDLLFQVLLDWGLELSMPIVVERIKNHEVFIVEDGALIACFDSEVSTHVVREMAKREPLRAVFRDSAFASDGDRINAEQIFTEMSPSTDVKVI